MTMTSCARPTLGAESTATRKRRSRRREEDIRLLILDAAREEFSRRGYEGATTRAIAECADVSESLLFRYFGAKSALFEAVAFEPFNELMSRFYDSRATSASLDDHLANTRDFVTRLTEYLRGNRPLIAALLRPGVHDSGVDQPLMLTGLENYFSRSRSNLDRLYLGLVGRTDPKADIVIRLGFGMVLASILCADWLFPGGGPSEQELTDGLVRSLTRMLAPEA
jgi:AcrR family transcriptional regulator